MRGLRFLFLLLSAPVLLAADGDAETFKRCGSGPRLTCVVDGDTLWFRGSKIRLADINTPEIFHPACRAEALLGDVATRRLIELLNAGPFELAPGGDGRDTDRYGRKLRVLLRDGSSLGLILADEGLAERWSGRRSDWCGT